MVFLGVSQLMEVNATALSSIPMRDKGEKIDIYIYIMIYHQELEFGLETGISQMIAIYRIGIMLSFTRGMGYPMTNPRGTVIPHRQIFGQELFWTPK